MFLEPDCNHTHSHYINMHLLSPGHLVPGQCQAGSVAHDLPVSAFVLTLAGCGFDPQVGLTKDYENGTHCLPAWDLNDDSPSAGHPSFRGGVR